MAKKLITYIFPIYNEEKNIDVLYEAMQNVIEPRRKNYHFEFIFINDGSRDASLDKLVALHEKDAEIRIINFSRNFGHQLAVTAGLDHANGDAVIIMDSDLQDPPEVSLELVKKWERGFEVVYAQRRTRQDTPFKKISAWLFYYTLHRLADIDIPRNTGDFRLLDRAVVDELKKFPEHNRFLRGLVSYIGFSQTAVLFDRHERFAGETGYPLKKMLKFASDGILGFSTVPLRLISQVGYILSLLSFIGILYALAMWLFKPDITVPGWTLTIIAILLIGGIQSIMLGVVGGYVGRIYTEAQNRPLYVIKQLYQTKQEKS